MLTVLLSILKIVGIVLLCVFLLILTILFLILFVPVRYRITGCRREGDDVPVRVNIRITWLLHLLNAAFRYPEEAFIKVRIFCFTVFSTYKQKSDNKTPKQNKQNTEKEEQVTKENAVSENKQETVTRTPPVMESSQKDTSEKDADADIHEETPTLLKFFKKLISILKNIKYTITKICDKIRHIIKNIRFYIGVVQSDPFKNAWSKCGGEAVSLVKSILPGKLTGNFTIGTGDPASTAQILSVWGMLYPLIGTHINIVPDFDSPVFEGDFFMQGKITVFKVLMTAIKVYFNKDLRRVIRLFKKGGSVNG